MEQKAPLTALSLKERIFSATRAPKIEPGERNLSRYATD